MMSVLRICGELGSECGVISKLKHRSGYVMVLYFFGAGKSGFLIQLKGVMWKEVYHNIFQREAMPSESEFIREKIGR